MYIEADDMGNIETVKEIYEAFGRGDVPAILERLHPEVAWEAWADNHAQRAGVPHLVPRAGREGVAEFFGVVGQMDVRDFRVLDVFGGERQVAAEIVIETDSFRDEELHLWTFDPEGMVVRMRHYVDTAKHIGAAA